MHELVERLRHKQARKRVETAVDVVNGNKERHPRVPHGGKVHLARLLVQPVGGIERKAHELFRQNAQDGRVHLGSAGGDLGTTPDVDGEALRILPRQVLDQHIGLARGDSLDQLYHRAKRLLLTRELFERIRDAGRKVVGRRVVPERIVVVLHRADSVADRQDILLVGAPLRITADVVERVVAHTMRPRHAIAACQIGEVDDLHPVAVGG